MSYIEKRLHLARSVVASTITANRLILIDSTPTIYQYTLDGEYISHSSIPGFGPLGYRYTKALSVSEDGQYTLLCDPDNSRALLIALETKKVMLQIKMDKQPKFSCFSPDMLYFIVTNSVGRILLYNLTSLEVYDEFAFPDEIANAIFTHDSTKLIVSTLDKSVYIYDIATKKIDLKFELNDIAGAISLGNDNNNILLFKQSGNTMRYNITSKKIYRVEPSYEWAISHAHSRSHRVVIIGTRSSQLFFYTPSKGDILGTLSFDYWGITSLSCSDKTLFVGFSDGNGIVLDASEPIKKAISAIDANNFEKLCLIAQEFPLIFINKGLCGMIGDNYKEIFAYEPVTPEERKGFDALISLLLNDEEKHPELLKELFSSEEIVTFTQEYELGKNSDACALVYKAPLLRQLKEYSKLRTNCYKNIIEDLKVLEHDPLLFEEYLESKENSCLKCAHGVVNYSESFVEAYNKLKSSAFAHNYASVFEITQKYPIFRQTMLFKRIMYHAESLIDKTLIMLGANKVDEALKYATKLTLIKPFAKTGQDFKVQIMMYTNFKKACISQNIQQVFSIIKENPALRTTELFKEQVRLYQEYIKPTIIMAQHGEVSEVIKHLSKYAVIEYFEAKNNDLIRLALLYEIKNYAPVGEEKELLEKYYRCFGWDEHYQNVCTFFQIDVKKEMRLDQVDPTCYEKTTFLLGERKKRKDHFKIVGEIK